MEEKVNEKKRPVETEKQNGNRKAKQQSTNSSRQCEPHDKWRLPCRAPTFGELCLIGFGVTSLHLVPPSHTHFGRNHNNILNPGFSAKNQRKSH
ncbi:hypothetical protein EUGRSUZ_L03197 [Eucalyptus grandis]|uniref:Uncharacterized protein n=1 Tax=Eucalyptus grandis TaxID=71139 RepID=A0AAD9T864_EUCGR|nr:hypothetical protein EUGRSUZ_L03197 [Eucalyptus grandis]